MKSKTKNALFFLIVLLFMLACSGFETSNAQWSDNHSNSSNTSRSTFVDKSEIVVIELEVKSDMQSNVLKINNIEIDEGEITMRLLTPEKESIWEEVLVSPMKFSERFDLELMPGLWKLELEMDAASGSYDIKWEAKD